MSQVSSHDCTHWSQSCTPAPAVLFLLTTFFFQNRSGTVADPPRPTHATLYVEIEPETLLSSPLCLQALSNLQDLCKADVCLTPPVAESRKLLSFLVVSTLDKSSLQSNVAFISRAKVGFFWERENRNAGTRIQWLRSATPSLPPVDNK